MHRTFSEESLSAYLDGELSVDERRQAESLLTENSSARRLLRELRALQVNLGWLPRYRLDEGFVGRVLREAERRLLVRGQPASTSRRYYGMAMCAAATVLIVICATQFGRQTGETAATARLDRAGASNNLQAIEMAAPHDELSIQAAKESGPSGFVAAANAPSTPSAESTTSYFESSDRLSKADSGGGAGGRQMQSQLKQTSAEGLEAIAGLNADQSYVCDIQSPLVQNQTLLNFERLLNRQQIVVDEDPADGNAVRSKIAAAPALAPPASGPPANAAAGQELERVYVVDATPEQLANTVVELDAMAAQSNSQLRVRRLGRETPEPRVRLEADVQRFDSVANPQRSSRYAAPAQQVESVPQLQQRGQALREPPATQAAGGGEKAVQSQALGEPLDRSTVQGNAVQGNSAKSITAKDNIAKRSGGQAESKPSAAKNLGTEPAQPTVPAPRGEPASEPAAVANETQRAIFIFRVAPSVANPSPAPVVPAAKR